jgi:hypothetical protein
MGLALIAAAREMSAQHFSWNSHFERLAGGRSVRESLEAGEPAGMVAGSWAGYLSGFIQKREKYLLYA